MSRNARTGDTPGRTDPDRLDPVEAAYRRSRDDYSEFGWGAGLDPHRQEDAIAAARNPSDPTDYGVKGPAQGGRYSTAVPGTRIA